jgi:hypothetical protein
MPLHCTGTHIGCTDCTCLSTPAKRETEPFGSTPAAIL